MSDLGRKWGVSREYIIIPYYMINGNKICQIDINYVGLHLKNKN